MLLFELMNDREENPPDGVFSINGIVQQGAGSVKDAECIEGDHSVLS
jgi:hypothetical protein